jgi:hypothetical protein
MLDAGPGKGQDKLILVFSLLILIGAVAFLFGVLGGAPLRAWMAYLINFVFWTGLAFGAIFFSPIMVITKATWGRPMKRLAESFSAFLPVAFVLFLIMYFGKEEIFPWVLDPIPEKEKWLNAGFLFVRDGLALLVLSGTAVALIYRSVRSDVQAVSEGKINVPEIRRKDPQFALSVAYGILYAYILSLLSIDLIMSLSPHWHSTLFGAYYFMGSLYMGLAALMVLCAVAVKTMGMGAFIKSLQFYNLGKLILGFCLMTGDFFFTQFLVIWSGNLPEETRYVIRRVYIDPWNNLAWVVLLVFFVLPFIVLLRRNLKRKPNFMLGLSIFILGGMWLEKLLLVAPSIWKERSIPLGWMEVFVTTGFFGMAAMSVLMFLRRFPVLPVSDPMFHKSLEAEEE